MEKVDATNDTEEKALDYSLPIPSLDDGENRSAQLNLLYKTAKEVVMRAITAWTEEFNWRTRKSNLVLDDPEDKAELKKKWIAMNEKITTKQYIHVDELYNIISKVLAHRNNKAVTVKGDPPVAGLEEKITKK
mmetsp:Transcript_23861/g.49271  ORF Transcript_23861/g.49271 Transcript_23861/m.49271 type:complete len:133 (-) Transcript_23861:45-443(-)